MCTRKSASVHVCLFACVLLAAWYSASCCAFNYALNPPPSILACRDNYWAKLLLPLAILILGFKFSHSYPPFKRKQMLDSMQQSNRGI
jgi:hypothetical protein